MAGRALSAVPIGILRFRVGVLGKLLHQKNMRARIAWLSEHGKPEPTLVNAARSAGYELILPPALGINPAIARAAIIDVRRSATPACSARDLLNKSALAGRPGVTVILARQDLKLSERQALQNSGNIVFDYASSTAVIARLRQQMRMSSLAEEASERLKAAMNTALPADTASLTPKKQSPSILFAGAPSPITASALYHLRAYSPVSVLTAGQTLRALENKNFDAIVFSPSEENDLLYALARTLMRHARFSTIPIFAVSQNMEIVRAFSSIGADAYPSEIIDNYFAHRVGRAAQRGRLARGLRHFLHSTRNAIMSASPATSATFFATQIHQLIRRRRMDPTPFSMIGVTLVAKPNTTTTSNTEKIESAELAELCTKACRLEDAIVPLNSKSIVIITPSTNWHDATRIAARLTGVLAGRTTGDNNPSAYIPVTDIVEHKAGEGAQALLARLLDQLRTSTRHFNTALSSSL